MKYELNLWVLGGDLRQAHLARLLSEHGHHVHVFALEQAGFFSPLIQEETDLSALSRADAVILPMPVADSREMLFSPLSESSIPISHVLDAMDSRQFLCGGRLSPAVHSQILTRGLTLWDYFAREELAVANCVPTAEGCIQLAMEHLDITIHNARVLVIGCGRLGRITAGRFGALGAKVTVAARKYDQLAWAAAEGYSTEHTGQLAGWLCSYDLIINTVPALVLGREELNDTRPDCLIIDLASDPGGVDRAAADALGRTVLWALSLPGKTAPVTAGEIIMETVLHMLQERGY